jgi:predicted anti-sigma-YlaC factor YlaD
MKCNELKEMMPELALGSMEPSAKVEAHLKSCTTCALYLAEMRQTMALLDEWKAPEPTPYFDARLQARLREEKTKERSRGWLAWLSRPALAAVATVLVAASVGLYVSRGRFANPDGAISVVTTPPAVGSAVGDLETLDKDNELYADFDVLDELDSQNQDSQQANP